MSEFLGKYNEIISALVSNGVLTTEKIQYAERVLSKLKGDYRLLDVLKKLHYITDDDIWNAVQKKRLSTRLGNLLVDLGYISQQQLDSAIEVQKKERESRSSAVIVSGIENVSDEDVAKSKSIEFGYQYIEPDFESIPHELIIKCRPEWYEMHRFFPVSTDKTTVTVGFADPSVTDSLDAAREFFGEDLSPVILRSELISSFISRYRTFIQSGSIYSGSGSVGKGAFQSIISSAIEREGVTDIFIEPMRDRVVVKFRENCLSRKHQELPPQVKSSLFNYIREFCLEESVVSGNSICHEFNHEKGIYLLTGSIVHTRFGDSASLSIRKLVAEPQNLLDLPMSKNIIEKLKMEVIDNNQGVFLISGIDGSAKNLVLQSIMKKKKKIMPESRMVFIGGNSSFSIDDVMYVNADHEGLDSQIKKVSELVPDVISVSGLKDVNSCQALVSAASTGIQCMASMRTALLADALNPFMDYDKAPAISAHLTGILHQKVIRRVCPICVTPLSLQVDLLRKIGINPNDLAGLKPMKGVGCKSCGHTGYNGLIILAELLIPDEKMRDAMVDVRSAYHLKRYMPAIPGFINLVEDAILWVGDGQTTIEEIARVFPSNQKIRSYTELQKIREA